MILCKIFSPAKLCRTRLWDSCCLSQNGLKSSQCLKRILEEIRKVVLCHDVIAAKYLARVTYLLTKSIDEYWCLYVSFWHLIKF